MQSGAGDGDGDGGGGGSGGGSGSDSDCVMLEGDDLLESNVRDMIRNWAAREGGDGAAFARTAVFVSQAALRHLQHHLQHDLGGGGGGDGGGGGGGGEGGGVCEEAAAAAAPPPPRLQFRP